jgi:hypothetical protein
MATRTWTSAGRGWQEVGDVTGPLARRVPRKTYVSGAPPCAGRAYHRPVSPVAYFDRGGREPIDSETVVWTEVRALGRGRPGRPCDERCYPERRDERQTQRGPLVASQPVGGPRLPER